MGIHVPTIFIVSLCECWLRFYTWLSFLVHFVSSCMIYNPVILNVVDPNVQIVTMEETQSTLLDVSIFCLDVLINILSTCRIHLSARVLSDTGTVLREVQDKLENLQIEIENRHKSLILEMRESFGVLSGMPIHITADLECNTSSIVFHNAVNIQQIQVNCAPIYIGSE
jgi:hypothetical protein